MATMKTPKSSKYEVPEWINNKLQ